MKKLLICLFLCLFILPVVSAEWSYTNINYDLGSHNYPQDVVNNGTHWFVPDAGDSKIYVYDSSWAYTGINYSSVLQDNSPIGIFYNSTHWFKVGDQYNKIYVYDSSWSYTSVSYDISAQDTNPTDLYFNSTHWFLLGDQKNFVYIYNSSWGYSGISYNLTAQDSAPIAIWYNSGNWYILGNTNKKVFVYNSSWGYSGISYNFTAQDGYPQDIYFYNNNWYLPGTSFGNVYLYSGLNSASTFNQSKFTTSLSHNTNFLLQLNASDADGNNISWSINDSRFTINQSGWINKTAPHTIGSYNLSITLNDSTTTTTDWILINFTNTAPTFNQSKFTYFKSHGLNFTLQINASDSDGNTILYSSNNSMFSISSSGLITKNMSAISTVGLYNVSITLNDSITITTDWIRFNLTSTPPTNDNLTISPAAPTTESTLVYAYTYAYTCSAQIVYCSWYKDGTLFSTDADLTSLESGLSYFASCFVSDYCGNSSVINSSVVNATYVPGGGPHLPSTALMFAGLPEQRTSYNVIDYLVNFCKNPGSNTFGVFLKEFRLYLSSIFTPVQKTSYATGRIAPGDTVVTKANLDGAWTQFVNNLDSQSLSNLGKQFFIYVGFGSKSQLVDVEDGSNG